MTATHITGDERQAARRSLGVPCYCGSLPDTLCDFCSGLAPEGGARWEDAQKEMKEEAGRTFAADLREMMNQWDRCMKLAMSQGLCEDDAARIVRKAFEKSLHADTARLSEPHLGEPAQFSLMPEIAAPTLALDL